MFREVYFPMEGEWRPFLLPWQERLEDGEIPDFWEAIKGDVP